MTENSKAIIVLCSHLCTGENIFPYEPSHWSKFADKLKELNLIPADVINFKIDELRKYFDEEESNRIYNLNKRSASIFFEINKYKELGINVVTRADKNYPKNLKLKLGKLCPPLFYYVGNLDLCNLESIGFVGSRTISNNDELLTKILVENAVKENYAIVSGGAKGIDITASHHALNIGAYVVEYISDSLLKKIKNKETINAIRNNKLVILSLSKPDAGFNTGLAMSRNKYIYSQSKATVVIKSDFEKGGTWAGATESLRKKYSVLFCNDNKHYKGNAALIEKGAIPINEFYNFNKNEINILELNNKDKPEVKQYSLFD